MRFRRCLSAILTVAFALSGLAQTLSLARSAQGPTSDWFLFHEYAQLTFDSSPLWEGASGLDVDGDGVACPELTRLLDAGVRRLTPPEGNVETGTVTEIVDGDTIHVVLDATGEDRSVRTIVTNAPERGDCYGANATRAVERIIPVGTPVWLQRIDRDTDKNDRLLRHVWYQAGNQDRMLEHETTMRGYTFAKDYGDGSPYLPYVADAMQAAYLADFGIWRRCDGIGAPADQADVTALAEGRAGPLPLAGPLIAGAETASEPAPVPTQAPIGIGGNCEPSYPTICIPIGSADLDCPDVAASFFTVVPPDPHRFDGDFDGIGCES